MSAGEIPRIRGDDVAAIADAVRRREPVVLTGGRRGLAKRLVDRWTFDYLRRTAGPAATFPVHYAPRGSAFQAGVPGDVGREERTKRRRAS
jgi:hypothetical protein